MTPRRKWPLVVLIVLQLVQAATLFPWLMMAGLAVMAFDAPGSTQMWQPWAFVLAVWSYPLWLLAAAAGSWTLYALRWNGTAVGLCLLFTLPMPVLLLILMLGN